MGAQRAEELLDAAEGRLDDLLAAIEETVSAISTFRVDGLPGISLALDIAGTRPGGPSPLPRETWRVISTGVLRGLANHEYRKGSIKAELVGASSYALIAAAHVTAGDELEAHEAIDEAYRYLVDANRPRIAGG